MKLKSVILVFAVFFSSIYAGQRKEIPSLEQMVLDNQVPNFINQFKLLTVSDISFEDLKEKFDEYSKEKKIGKDLYEKFLAEVIHQIIFLNAQLHIDKKIELYKNAFDEYGLHDLFFLHEILTNMESTGVKTINDVSPNGKTILLFAAQSKDPRVIRYLVNRGANINAIQMPQKFTPLHLAIRYNQLEIIKTLLELGVDINFTSTMGSALNMLVNQKLPIDPEIRIEALKLILKKKPDLTIIDEDGLTPLENLEALEKRTVVSEWVKEAKKLIMDYKKNKRS